MNFLLDLGFTFLMLGFMEAVVKPIAKRFVQRKVLRYSPIVLAYLDKQLLQLLGKYTGPELEQIVNAKLEELTGEPWNKSELNEVFKIFDVRIAADRLQGEKTKI
jgi:hypothetical protein